MATNHQNIEISEKQLIDETIALYLKIQNLSSYLAKDGESFDFLMDQKRKLTNTLKDFQKKDAITSPIVRLKIERLLDVYKKRDLLFFDDYPPSCTFVDHDKARLYQDVATKVRINLLDENGLYPIDALAERAAQSLQKIDSMLNAYLSTKTIIERGALEYSENWVIHKLAHYFQTQHRANPTSEKKRVNWKELLKYLNSTERGLLLLKTLDLSNLENKIIADRFSKRLKEYSKFLNTYR